MIKITDQECYQHHKDTLENYEATKHLAVFNITENRANDIQEALLKYRRDNNIFEVGDLVVILTMHLDNKFIHEVSKVLEDLVGVCGSYIYSSELRHATPSEIKAGYRL